MLKNIKVFNFCLIRLFGLPNVHVQKIRYFEKSKTICVTFFNTKKSPTLNITQFPWHFSNWRRGGAFIHTKNKLICVEYCTFCYVSIHKKLDTLRHIFICKKQCTLRYVFVSKNVTQSV